MAEASYDKPLNILLVEDNPADVRMTREALGIAKVKHALHVVSDGEQAIAFLRRQGEFAEAPVPDIMLLDLSIPRIDGHGVLEELRPPRGRPFPVIVITGSKLQRDLERSYELGADQHVTKPAGILQYAAELKFALGLARARSS